MSPLKPPLHVQQIALGYCLPACAQMALAQLGVEVSQAQLAKTLGTRAGVGTPFSRVELLKQWQVEVQITEWGTIEMLAAALMMNTAIITAVTTTFLHRM